MRAAALRDGRIEILDLPDPVPGAGKALLAPLFAGICGSDLHLQSGLKAAAEPLSAPERANLPIFVPGHEFSARVIAFGPDTDTALKPGQRVVPLPFTPNGHGFQIVGLSPDHSGGIATLSVVDASRCILVPDAIGDDLAALTEPLSVGLHAANLACKRAGPNVIVGCGPVGLAVLLALKSQGRGPVLAADFSAERRAAAERLGADIVIDPARDSPFSHWDDLAFAESQISALLTPDQIGTALGPNIFDCVGAPGILNNIFKNAPRHTHLIVVGACPHEDKHVPQDGIVREISVDYSFAYTPEEFSRALRMIGDHGETVSQLVTSRLPLERTAEAFDRLAARPSEIKVLIQPQ
ncbi:MAG: zinc-binding dehydrogenase [Rhodoblastus sp.]